MLVTMILVNPGLTEWVVMITTRTVGQTIISCISMAMFSSLTGNLLRIQTVTDTAITRGRIVVSQNTILVNPMVIYSHSIHPSTRIQTATVGEITPQIQPKETTVNGITEFHSAIEKVASTLIPMVLLTHRPLVGLSGMPHLAQMHGHLIRPNGLTAMAMATAITVLKEPQTQTVSRITSLLLKTMILTGIQTVGPIHTT